LRPYIVICLFICCFFLASAAHSNTDHAAELRQEQQRLDQEEKYCKSQASEDIREVQRKRNQCPKGSNALYEAYNQQLCAQGKLSEISNAQYQRELARIKDNLQSCQSHLASERESLLEKFETESKQTENVPSDEENAIELPEELKGLTREEQIALLLGEYDKRLPVELRGLSREEQIEKLQDVIAEQKAAKNNLAANAAKPEKPFSTLSPKEKSAKLKEVLRQVKANSQTKAGNVNSTLGQNKIVSAPRSQNTTNVIGSTTTRKLSQQKPTSNLKTKPSGWQSVSGRPGVEFIVTEDGFRIYQTNDKSTLSDRAFVGKENFTTGLAIDPEGPYGAFNKKIQDLAMDHAINNIDPNTNKPNLKGQTILFGSSVYEEVFPTNNVEALETATGLGVGGVAGKTVSNLAKSKSLIRLKESSKSDLKFVHKLSPRYSSTQLQHEFKHAKDFGISGNWNKANGQAFETALQRHIVDPKTRAFKGTFNDQPVTHYYNSTTGNNVFIRPNGDFWGGWKLSLPQTEHILKHGDLR